MREKIGVPLALTVALAAGCNGQQDLKENPNNGLYGTPHVAPTSERPAVDGPYGCYRELEEYRLEGPVEGAAYNQDGSPAEADAAGKDEEQTAYDYTNLRRGSVVLATNLGNCVITQGIESLDSPADVEREDTFAIVCRYKDTAKDVADKLVVVPGNDPWSREAQKTAGFIGMSEKVETEMAQAPWLGTCVGYAKIPIPDVSAPVYPDQSTRPVDQ
jgi:hypothetical protein